MIRNRLAVATVLAVAIPMTSHAAINPTQLAWNESQQAEAHEACVMTSQGYIAGSLAFAVGGQFRCGAQQVLPAGGRASLSGTFTLGANTFAAASVYQFASEFRHQASNEAAQVWVTYANTLVRPWSCQVMGLGFTAPYTVYEIALGTARVEVTSEFAACGSEGEAEVGDAMDDSGNAPNVLVIDRSRETLPSDDHSPEFIVAVRNLVAERSPGAGAVWTEGAVLKYVSGTDLANIPAAVIHDHVDDPDPIRKGPSGDLSIKSNRPARTTLGAIKNTWR